MAAFRAVLLLFLCRLPLASSCIPTVTPDDMYEDEMEATTSVLLTTVLDMTAETTSQATTTTTTTTGMCPSAAWILNSAINFCYLLVPASSGTVDDALCDAQVAGATLASIHNADENAFILSIIDDAATDYVFIGGYSPTGMLGTFYWTDGTMYGPYENWSSGYPVTGLNCMVMSAVAGYAGQWYNTPCNNAPAYDLLCMIAA